MRQCHQFDFIVCFFRLFFLLLNDRGQWKAIMWQNYAHTSISMRSQENFFLAVRSHFLGALYLSFVLRSENKFSLDKYIVEWHVFLSFDLRHFHIHFDSATMFFNGKIERKYIFLVALCCANTENWEILFSFCFRLSNEIFWCFPDRSFIEFFSFRENTVPFVGLNHMEKLLKRFFFSTSFSLTTSNRKQRKNENKNEMIQIHGKQ